MPILQDIVEKNHKSRQIACNIMVLLDQLDIYEFAYSWTRLCAIFPVYRKALWQTDSKYKQQ